MAIGPGKYDELCTYVREKARATGSIVIIFGGERGNGFSAQFGRVHLPLTGIAQVLREVADEIEQSGNSKG